MIFVPPKINPWWESGKSEESDEKGRDRRGKWGCEAGGGEKMLMCRLSEEEARC